MSWIDTSTTIPTWNLTGNISSSRQFSNTFIKGLLDISGGNIVLRNGGLYTQTDISCNGNIFGSKCYITGNLAVGKTTAGFPLDVNGIINATALYVNGSPYIGSQWTTGSGNIYFNSGNVGIGKTNPIYPLDVTNDIRVTRNIISGNVIYTNIIQPYITSNTITVYYGTTSTLALQNDGNFVIYNGASAVMNCTNTGTITATTFNATSDYRIKDNLIPITTNLFNIDNLKPYTYFHKQTKRQDIGFIAHEVAEHIPYITNGEKDQAEYQSVNYISIIPLLVKEIQNAKKEIAFLKTKINLV